VHTAVIGERPRVDLASLGRGTPAPDLRGALAGEREVWFDGGWQRTPVYLRASLPVDAALLGPAVIEQLDCTTVLEPGDRAHIDRLGNILIEV